MRSLVLTVLIGACATGSTYRSGVGDKLLEHPPYYAGSAPAPAADTARVGHLPVGYQRGSTQSPIFEPENTSGTPVAAFIAELTAYLDSLGLTTRIATAPARGTPPDVRFSCETDPAGPDDECAVGEGAIGRDDIVMHLAVGRPSSDWVQDAAAAMDSARAGSMLVITLEIGQYRVRQRGLVGAKEVELGTKHVVGIPWLTSLETPVQVLQLTGARVGRDGRAQRIGAEGILARRTSLPISAIGGQALISDAEVEQARTARREDLPGQPLVWQVALRNLVRGLSGR
ncbi:MAG TPA: hypothetical protein VFO67_14835 [Gemmatimonadales bacterium]|nr:hypothetical protein [Gemmatimonadales bacterium]